jgi:hypothetical protein
VRCCAEGAGRRHVVMCEAHNRRTHFYHGRVNSMSTYFTLTHLSHGYVESPITEE